MTQFRFRSLGIVAVMLIGSARLDAAETEAVPSVASTNVVESAATNDLDNLSKAQILKLIQNLADELKQTRSELEQLKAARSEEKSKAVTPSAPVAIAPPAAPPVPAPAEAAKERTEAEQERERVERERAIQSVQRSGVLLPPGKFDVEPGFTYSHSSLNLINVDGFSILPVLVIGDIQSLRVTRDTFQTSLALRFGVLPNLQADVAVPFQYEEDTYVTQSAQNNQQLAPKETNRHDQGIGDVQFGLSYQLLHEHGWVPDLIVQSTARAPTGKSQFDISTSTGLPQGTGVWGVRGGITAIKTMDPIVLIFNTGYTYNFGRDFTVQQITDTGTNAVSTTYQPGGSIDVGVAVAVAMNPSFAINLGVLERYTFSTELTGIGTVQGSSLNESQFRFGFAWAVTRNAVFNFTAGAGLTEDTPDLTITVSCPIKF
ncbi:MAG: transporter [Verrucomicrobiota bacterium]